MRRLPLLPGQAGLVRFYTRRQGSGPAAPSRSSRAGGKPGPLLGRSKATGEKMKTFECPYGRERSQQCRCAQPTLPPLDVHSGPARPFSVMGMYSSGFTASPAGTGNHISCRGYRLSRRAQSECNRAMASVQSPHQHGVPQLCASRNAPLTYHTCWLLLGLNRLHGIIIYSCALSSCPSQLLLLGLHACTPTVAIARLPDSQVRRIFSLPQHAIPHSCLPPSLRRFRPATR